MNLKLINQLNHIISELEELDGSLERARELLKDDIITYCEVRDRDIGQSAMEAFCEIVDRRFNEL